MIQADDRDTPRLGSKVIPFSGRILLVEDNEQERELMNDALVDAGYEVVEASEGREALNLLLQMTSLPAAIVLDVHMPIMDGWELLKIIRSYHRLSGIPVIVVSGKDPDLRSRSLYAEFLSKPIDPAMLIDAVNRIAERGRAP